MIRLRNTTNIDDRTIRQIVAAVAPAQIGRYDIEVRNSRSVAGRAYIHGSGFHATARPFIVCRVPTTDINARRVWPSRGAYLPMAVGSRVEALVVLIAHELRHLWQRTHSRGRVHGSRGRYSEKDADAYALRMLRRYRRSELGIGSVVVKSRIVRNGTVEYARKLRLAEAAERRWTIRVKRAKTALEKARKRARYYRGRLPLDEDIAVHTAV